MPLDEYRRKRDFSRTPEPAGTARPKGPRPARFFCVQKHLASHLHYDFRLEHNGVLLSWAVPKGPSLNPADRRLAMHVEDHPVDYGAFEGVIPEGYGAGIVLLWDRGTWTPEVEDVDAALRKGDLKFTLDGYKLKGSWVLVRTRGGGDRSWLLIKHRDDWSGEVDVVASFPMSVKSAGDFEDILAADNPSVWVSNRPAKGGEAGTLLAGIIERAAALKAGKQADAKPSKAARPPRRTTTRAAARPKIRATAERTTTKTVPPKSRATPARKSGTKPPARRAPRPKR